MTLSLIPISTCERVQRQQLSVEADGETRGAQSAVFLQSARARRLFGAQQLSAGRLSGAHALILKPEPHTAGSCYSPDFLLEDAGIIYPQICVIFTLNRAEFRTAASIVLWQKYLCAVH